MIETEVKKYKGDKKYQRDAQRMARAGWHVSNVVDMGKPGWAWFVGPIWVKRRYLVTYTYRNA